MQEIIEYLFSATVGVPWRLVAFVFVALLQLGIAFGLTWRYCQWVKGRLAAWRRQPIWLQCLLAPLVLLAALLAGGFLINDLVVNLIVLTIWWLVITAGKRGWPCGPLVWKGKRLPWIQLVTGRTQIYLDQWALDPSSFNWLEVATLRFIVRFAILFDPDHFYVPAGFL